MLSPRVMCAATNRLVQRSSSSTAKAIRKLQARMIRGRGIFSSSISSSPELLCFQFFQHRRAALAYFRILLVFANVDGIVPATFALFTCGLVDLHQRRGGAPSGGRFF